MSSSFSVQTLPTVADVEHIASHSDPVVRNLQITQCYHELSSALFARTGPQANWCTFATWASKQAGQSIRKEDLRRFLVDILKASPTTHLAVEDTAALAQRLGAKGSREQVRQEVWKLIDLSRAVDHSSQAVARGNVKVFEEIGREFARFCATCLPDASPHLDHIAEFCAQLRAGDPPDGQDALRQAFTHLYAALFEPDPKQRAERLFLSNLLIGFHEQTRLQPEIQSALDAPYLDGSSFAKNLLRRAFPLTGWMVLQARALAHQLLNRPPLIELAAGALLERVHLQIRQAITETLMTISFPKGLRLRLGIDLTGQYPACLQQLAFQDLSTLLEKIDPTPDSLRESGVVDWSILTDRLHFIVELFRLYHEAEYLFDSPFTLQQVEMIKAGQLPAGRL